MRIVAALALFVLTVTSHTQTSEALQARDNLNQGIRAFRERQYEMALGHLQSAIKQDPELMEAHLYLGQSYAAMLTPGSESERHKELAERAIQAFETVLKRQPTNAAAVAGLAFVYQNTNQMRKAREFYLRNAELNPQNAAAFYSVAAVNWIIVFNKQTPASPEEKSQLTEEGLRYVDTALTLNRDYSEAMTYRNLLLREKARLTSDPEEQGRLIAEADVWFERALDSRRRNAQGARGASTPPPPPPPPQPPSMIRISQTAADTNLISRPPLVYPPLALEARLQGSVILEVVINKEGSVESVRAISGHPMLMDAAVENVRQWRYRPILLNGAPIDVVSTITLNYQLQ